MAALPELEASSPVRAWTLADTAAEPEAELSASIRPCPSAVADPLELAVAAIDPEARIAADVVAELEELPLAEPAATISATSADEPADEAVVDARPSETPVTLEELEELAATRPSPVIVPLTVAVPTLAPGELIFGVAVAVTVDVPAAVP
jgi:hypothetical protein